MKKKYITILIFGILGLILSFMKIQNGDIVEPNNLMFLNFSLTLIFLLPYIFPFLKNIGFGTLDFYPNLFKKIFK
jgi:uncharacterized membrane protein YozB (DUF420 family)